MRLSAEVLGPFRLIADGTPVDLGGPRQRRILGMLIVHRGSVVSTDRLIEAVFEGDPPEAAPRTFRTYVARLRRALEVAGVDAASVLVTEAKGYVVPAAAVDLDSKRFEDALADAQDRLAVGDFDGAALGLDDALALWSGSAYGEFADEEWACIEATRLTELRTVARELRAEAVLESGRHAAVIPDIEVLISESPFRDEPRRLLMVALYRSGRHADALRAGREYRRFLGEETGLEPSRGLHELEQLILDQDPRLEPRPQGHKLRGYLLGPPIAQTELGITYRASQPSVGRTVAITAIPPEQADDPTFVRRFEVHAQRIASIEHPNVVPIYDYWREPGAAYMVTRFLPGGSLTRRLAEGSVVGDERMRIVREVGAALSAAHERGVAHGQLNASSVLFDGAGTAYLAGFDIDADQRSMPSDIVALGQLADELWARQGVPTGDTQAGVAVAARVRAIVQRAHGAETDPPFGSVAEMVAAIEAAASGGVAAPTSSEAATIEGPNPYRGLFAFVESDADVFFGRERLVEDMISDLDSYPFLAVVGPSGSGKSSAVRAGLLPHLRARGAFVATMVPGERPLAELEVALSRVATTQVPDLAQVLAEDPSALGRVLRELMPEPEHEVVLVIDQFEEAFTLANADERDVLLAALVHTLNDQGARLRVVVTVRADFLGPILDHRVLGAVVRDHSRLVTPLDAAELHAAIVGPAEVAGVAVESALATALVADAATSAGALPLLQYALTELYEHRVDGTLTVDAYRRQGGLGAILSQRAEEIHSGLGADDQGASRRLFSRLITPGEGAADTRRRAKQSELVGVSSDLLSAYGAARLISFDRDPSSREPTVEVAHEALISEWPRLRGWINEDREGVRTLRRLTASAAEWDASGRDDGELYRGGRLETADEWAGARADELSPAELTFLDASRKRRDAMADLERRRLRRLRSLLVTVAILAVAAVVAGLVAVAQRRAADENARQAELRRIMADSQATVDDNPNRALLLALEAHRLDPSLETLGALQTVVAGSPIDWLGDIENGKSYRRVEFLPDGLLVASNERGIEIWDLTDRVVVRERAFAAQVADMHVSSDGRLVAVGGSDRRWRVLDTANLDEVASGRTAAGIAVVRIDADQERVALGLVDGTVQVRALDEPARDLTLTATDGDGEPLTTTVTDVSMSADGRFLAAAWGAPFAAQQWSIAADAEPGPPLHTEGDARLVLYSDDVLYTASDDVQSFDPATGEPIGSPFNLPGGVESDMRMTAAGPSMLNIAGFGGLYIVDVTAESVNFLRYETTTTTWGSAVSPDGRVLAVAAVDGLALWALDGAGLFVDTVLPAAEKSTQVNAISTDGKIAVQAGNIQDEVTSLIWDISTPDAEILLESPSGTALRLSGTDVIRYRPAEEGLQFDRWDRVTNTFAPLMEADFVTFGVGIPVFTPDGRQFLHPWNNGQGILDVYDAASGALVARLTDVEDAAPPNTSYSNVPEFDTDGSRLVYPTSSEHVAVYNVDTWELLETFEPTVGFGEIVFTPDGDHAITHSSRGLEVRDATDLSTVLLGPVPGEQSPGLGRMLEITDDGRYLKTAGVKGAQLLDPATLTPIGSQFPHDENIWAATLAAGTNQLATVVAGATIVWDIDLDRWPELACLAAGRNLTQAEWEEYGPRGDYHPTCDRWIEG